MNGSKEASIELSPEESLSRSLGVAGQWLHTNRTELAALTDAPAADRQRAKPRTMQLPVFL